MQAVEYFSSAAEDFNNSYRHDPNRLERLHVWRDFMERYRSGVATAYDIGCGSGAIACELAKLGIRTTAIDGSLEMLAIARKNAQQQGLAYLEFRQHYLPVENLDSLEKADMVTASSVLEYLESIFSSLYFLHSLLRNGGVLLLSIPNRHSLSRKLVRMVYRVTGKPEYFGLLRHFVTVEEIKSMLIASGFIFLESAYFDRSDWVNRFLSCFLPPEFSSNMIIVAARKKALS